MSSDNKKVALVAPIKIGDVMFMELELQGAYPLPYQSSSIHGELLGVQMLCVRLYDRGVWAKNIIACYACGTDDDGEDKTSISLYEVSYRGKYGPSFSLSPLSTSAVATTKGHTVEAVLKQAIAEAISAAAEAAEEARAAAAAHEEEVLKN